ncbi:PD-(D/E)XK motif protein [Thiomonas sp. FB-Cd]|uniref:PD-(D/E)XK motif protein n=1 Tax=Thiomonas sp. FB-Cd TaxID=1158292 RepID=UPI0004DFAD41|nr:PD-(D/E)XK motif protein [Thiomonas sp. FB-Cd]
MTENPWGRLPAGAHGDLAALRAEPGSRIDMFWARRPDGNYTFLFALPDCAGADPDLPSLRGIETFWSAEKGALQLVLCNTGDWEIFATLCRDLIEIAKRSASDAEALDALAVRLARWQRLLMRGGAKLLDDREIRGLFAELVFLRDELMGRFGLRGLRFWKGPDGAPQDFTVGRWLFEIKAHLVGSSDKVRISSPEQLWAEPESPMTLVVTRLAQVQDASASLPALIADVRLRLGGDPTLEALLDERLAQVNYLPLPEYEDHRYDAVGSTHYAVTHGFPLLSRTAIVAGLQDVTYSIALNACGTYKTTVNWAAVMEELHG